MCVRTDCPAQKLGNKLWHDEHSLRPEDVELHYQTSNLCKPMRQTSEISWSMCFENASKCVRICDFTPVHSQFHMMPVPGIPVILQRSETYRSTRMTHRTLDPRQFLRILSSFCIHLQGQDVVERFPSEGKNSKQVSHRHSRNITEVGHEPGKNQTIPATQPVIHVIRTHISVSHDEKGQSDVSYGPVGITTASIFRHRRR